MSAYRDKYPRNTRRKKGRWKTKPSNSTAGRTKGESCQASPLERAICTRSRSYKWNSYEAWDKKYKTGVKGA